MEWLKNLFGFSKPIPKEKSTDGQIATDYDMTFISKGKCPNCETGTLYEGPSGGMSTNYRCGTCGQGFNIVIWENKIIRQWVENIGVNERYIIKETK